MVRNQYKIKVHHYYVITVIMVGAHHPIMYVTQTINSHACIRNAFAITCK